MIKEAQWYVLRIRSGLEKNIKKKIEEELISNNLLKDIDEFFIPTFNIVVPNTDIQKECVPLKGSIFVKCIMSDKLENCIYKISQVVGFYKTGSIYETVEQSFITNLKNKLQTTESSLKDKRDSFAIGEKVEIINHPVYSAFKEGIIANIKDNIFYINVIVLGQHTSIKLEKENIQKIS